MAEQPNPNEPAPITRRGTTPALDAGYGALSDPAVRRRIGEYLEER